MMLRHYRAECPVWISVCSMYLLVMWAAPLNGEPGNSQGRGRFKERETTEQTPACLREMKRASSIDWSLEMERTELDRGSRSLSCNEP